MASDLKFDLVMTAFQRRPTVHLMGNPAVYPEVFARRDKKEASQQNTYDNE